MLLCPLLNAVEPQGSLGFIALSTKRSHFQSQQVNLDWRKLEAGLYEMSELFKGAY